MNITIAQGIDIFFGVIILFNIFLGLWRGAIKEIFHIAGLIGSIYLSIRFYQKAGDLFISWGMPPEYGVPNIVGFLSIFFGAWILIKIVSHILNKFIKKVGLSFENRIFGSLLGFAKGGIIVFIICLIMNYVLSVDFSKVPSIHDAIPKIKESKVLTLIRNNMPLIEKAIGKDSRFAQMFPQVHKNIESVKTSAEDFKVTTEIGMELQKDPKKFNRLLELEEVKKLQNDPLVQSTVKSLLEDKEFVEAVQKEDWTTVGSKVLPLMQNKELMDKIKSIDQKKILEELKK